MGYEYVIKLKDGDLAALSRNPSGPSSIDELLRSIPIFKSNTENQYFYCSTENADQTWFSYVVAGERDLLFCSYRGEDYRVVVPYLCEKLLGICGHFEIEDA